MTYTWIEVRLRELKRKKRELGEALDLPPSRVSDILKGKRRIQSQEIAPLALFLQMDTSAILERIHRTEVSTGSLEKSKTEQITVVGVKENAGTNYDIWPADQQYIITLPRHTSYAGKKKFALEESSNRANSVKLYVCIREAPEKGSQYEDLLQLTTSPRANSMRMPKLENNFTFVIAYYEQY